MFQYDLEGEYSEESGIDLQYTKMQGKHFNLKDFLIERFRNFLIKF